MPSIGERTGSEQTGSYAVMGEESPFQQVAWQVREGDPLGASLP